MLKCSLLSFLLISSAFAQAPKVNVVQATSVTCSFPTALPDCRPTVVVIIDAKDANDKFLVGIRYLTKDGTETIESRYPVTGGQVSFVFSDDVIMLSATAGSLKTNQVGLWTRSIPLN